jgi:hypothetical protein
MKLECLKKRFKREKNYMINNEHTQETQDDNLAKIEKENSQLLSKIQGIDPNIDVEPNKSKEISKKSEMDKVNEEIRVKKELFEETQRENNKEYKHAQK